MADIQNYAKPYKGRILSVSFPVCMRNLFALLPLYFMSGGILCTGLNRRKVSVAITSSCICLSCIYVLISM